MNIDAQPKLRIATRAEHVQHLLTVIDSLIFIQIAIQYYSTNLTLLLLLRTASQVFYVQQHRLGTIQTQTQLLPVVVANLICIVTHIIHARPEATARSAHGYIHGGLILDLIGEKGPISKWRLVVHDLLIFGLQVLMLAVGHERNVIDTGKKDSIPTRTPAQDLDAEEAGVRASQEQVRSNQPQERPDDAHETEEGIEMQSFLSPAEQAPSSSAVDTDEDLVLTLNIRSSLTGLLNKNKENTADGTEGSGAIDRAAERAERLRNLVQQLTLNRLGG